MLPISDIRRRTCCLILTLIFILCHGTITYADDTGNSVSIPNVRLTDVRQHVSNPDSIISKAYEDSINNVLNMLEDSTKIQVAVVAVKNIGENDPREFATELFNKWGIGDKKTDNGLLILLVTDKDQRSIVFETGYGIEGVLPDALCSRIQKNNMLPFMKEGDFDKGMLAGVKVCSSVLIKNEIYSQPANDDEDSVLEGFLYLVGFLLFIYVVFFVIRPFCIRRKKRAHPEKCPACGQQTLLYEKNKVVRPATYKNEGLRVETYICTSCGHKEEKKYKINKLNHTGGGISGGTGIGRRNTGSFRSGGSWGGGRSGGGGSITRF